MENDRYPLSAGKRSLSAWKTTDRYPLNDRYPLGKRPLSALYCGLMAVFRWRETDASDCPLPLLGRAAGSPGGCDLSPRQSLPLSRPGGGGQHTAINDVILLTPRVTSRSSRHVWGKVSTCSARAQWNRISHGGGQGRVFLASVTAVEVKHSFPERVVPESWRTVPRLTGGTCCGVG